MANQKTLMQAKEAIDLLLGKIRNEAPQLSGKTVGFAQMVSNKLAEEISKDEADQFWSQINEDEADQFWSEDNPEGGCNDAHELACEIADDLCAGEESTVKVWCSKRLPNRKMFVTVTEENDTREVVWRWVEDKPENNNEHHQINNL